MKVVQNHPSVVFYAMSHNATGYDQDMDPDLLDGVSAPRDQWAIQNVRLALHAEAIVRKLDPSRIVYHHAGGNIGSMDTINFYPNFVPIQELSDWFGHWATVGVKPLFLCEYGAPFTWDWTMYRGWYKGQREFGSAAVPWEFCPASWNAQFLGDRAYKLEDAEEADLRWEAKQFQAGSRWHRWDYPVEVGSPRFSDRHTVLGMYIDDNWRADRTWGVSGISPWEHGHFWSLRPGVDRRGNSCRWTGPICNGLALARTTSMIAWDEWISIMQPPTGRRRTMARRCFATICPCWPTLAESPRPSPKKATISCPGNRSKNNSSRSTIRVTRFHFAAHGRSTYLNSRREASDYLETGQQSRIPLRFDLPVDLPAGVYHIHAEAHFASQVQTDDFAIHVLPRVEPVKIASRIALFDPDPNSSTADLLDHLGIQFQRISAESDQAGFDELIIGKSALSVEGPAPDISRVRDGLKVILFEQSSQVLEKRFGFRVVEYGLRQVFMRVTDH